MTDNLQHFPNKPKALWQYLINALMVDYDVSEKRSISYQLLEHFFAIDKSAIILNEPIAIIENKQLALNDAVKRLNNNEPIQYVVGYTFFHGHRIYVDPRVLIPRPETEELVDLVIRDNAHKSPTILDIGTGSGCIPISIKHAIPLATVYAVDIDEKALACASENARRYNQDIEFSKMDVLKDRIPYQDIDIIISNPPYVLEREKAEMHNNVLSFEPHLALFVSDHDPLAYYNAILKNVAMNLVSGGKIYFEINEGLAKEITELLFSYNFTGIEIVKDIFEKDRIAVAVKA